jgi:hypothetical protein
MQNGTSFEVGSTFYTVKTTQWNVPGVRTWAHSHQGWATITNSLVPGTLHIRLPNNYVEKNTSNIKASHCIPSWASSNHLPSYQSISL